MKTAFFLIATLLMCPQLALSQSNSQNRFVSAVDQSLEIKNVAVAPFTDNVSNIYGNHLDQTLKEAVNHDRQWTLLDLPVDVKEKYKVGTFEADSKLLMQLKANQEIDAVITGHLVKGTMGIQITLELYSTTDGMLLAQSELKDYKGFEINEVKGELIRLFQRLKDAIPYRAQVISRRTNQVTVNVGKNYGLNEGDELIVAHFIKLNRHPKKKFVVSSEKEIIGKIQIFKVDQALSFGSITFEKESGVIEVGSKILPIEFKKYPTPVLGPDGKLMSALEKREDAGLAFGKNPTEWRDLPPPQFGKLGLYLGAHQLSHKTNLTTAGSLAADNALVPEISARAELWFSPLWQVNIGLRQAVYSLTNDLSGSTPTTLNGSLSQFDGRLVHNILLNEDFFGPRWQVGLGFRQTKFTIDSSSPLSFADHNYGGIYLNLGGSFPISHEIPINMGAELQYFLTKNLAEGAASGTSAININSFNFFGDYQLSQHYKVRAELQFEYFSANLSNDSTRADPATNTSHRLNSLIMGIEYLF